MNIQDVYPGPFPRRSKVWELYNDPAGTILDLQRRLGEAEQYRIDSQKVIAQQGEQVAELKAYLAAKREQLDATIDAADRKIENLQAANRALAEALGKFGAHKPICILTGCQCGLAEALRAARMGGQENG